MMKYRDRGMLSLLRADVLGLELGNGERGIGTKTKGVGVSWGMGHQDEIVVKWGSGFLSSGLR